MNLSFLAGLANLMLLLLGQMDLQRTNILVQARQIRGARNRKDVVTLSHAISSDLVGVTADEIHT